MSAIDLAQALETAIDASQLAAAHAVKRQSESDEQLGVTTKASPRDYVTQVDKECQQIIVDRLRRNFPDHRFLGEEGGTDELGEQNSPYMWIIDPVDGTNPFIHGRDNFGNLIALQENGETILGVMNMPLKNDLFYGTKGSGAFWNGNPVVLRPTKSMYDAIICSNLVHRAREMNGVQRVTIPLCGSIENYGAAVEEFGLILKGQNDGVFFEGIPLWDIAAGCFLVQEAGGRSSYRPHASGTGYDVASSTAEIFDELEIFVRNDMTK